jgi:hypothetical protein
METAIDTSEHLEATTTIPPRLMQVGAPFAAYLKDKFNVIVREETILGRYTREPRLRVVYFFGKPYTTPQWGDEWFFARLRDQPSHGRSKPRPPLVAQLREQFRAEEDEILAGLSTAELTDRERSGDVWNDAPA